MLNLNLNILGRLNSGGGAQAFDSPAPLQVGALNDSVTAWAIKVGQDSFNWYIYESDGTTLVNQDLANSSNTKTWAGLTPDTTYVVKCESVGGSKKSELLSKSVTTCVTPTYAYLFSGLAYNTTNTTNSYGKTTTSNVDEVYSVLGTANNLTPVSTKSVIWSSDTKVFQNRKASIGVIEDKGSYIPATTYNFTGDFTVIFKASANNLGAGFANVLRNNTDVNVYLATSKFGARFRFGGGAIITVVYPTAGNAYGENTFVFKRIGTTFYASCDGGANYGSAAGYSGTAGAFDRVWPGNTAFYINKLLICDGANLTQAQISRLENIEAQSPFTLKAIDSNPTLKGLSFSSLGSDYIINSDFTAGVTGATSWTPLLTKGDYDFLRLTRKYASPTYGDDLIYVRKISTGEIAGPIVIDHPYASTDTHNTGSLAFINNTLIHVEMNVHYGPILLHTKVIVRSWGIDWNFSEMTVLPLGNNISSYVGSQMQYPQFAQGVDYIHIIFQEFDGTQARWIADLRSKDFFNSFEKIRILDTSGSNQWFYHKSFEMADGEIGIGINNLTNGSPDKYPWAGVCRSDDDFTTLYNFSKSYSKAVGTNDTLGVTLAEAKTNMTLDASYTTATNSIGIFHISYDPTDDMVYGLAANGTDNGINLFYWNGSSFTLVALDVQGLDVIYGMTADGSQSVSQGTNNPFCVRTGGSNFDIFLQVNLGSSIWKIVKLTTTDYGANCSIVGDVTNDATKNHHRIVPTHNIHNTGGSTAYNGNRTLIATREQSGTSDCFIKSI